MRVLVVDDERRARERLLRLLKEMRGVEADTKAFGVLDFVEDRREVRHAMAQASALTCCVFQRDADG